MICLSCLRLESPPSYQGLVQVGSLPENVDLAGIGMGMGERKFKRVDTEKKRHFSAGIIFIIDVLALPGLKTSGVTSNNSR